MSIADHPPAESVFRDMLKAFHGKKTLSCEWRIEQLNQLENMIKENRSSFEEALEKDLGRHIQETYLSEMVPIKQELSYAKNNLASWMKGKTVIAPVLQQPSSSYVLPQPKGVILIVSHWSFPLHKAIVPLIGAIAAGNCVVLKPSKKADNVRNLLATLIPKYLDSQCIRVFFANNRHETDSLLDLNWDHIFFCGSSCAGKHVAQMAGKYMTPCTLLLGGKSPAIVDKEVDLKTSAKRIVWGKFLNCGQSSIAPDYVLVHKDIYEELLNELKQACDEFYGQDAETSASYGKIISVKKMEKLVKLMEGAGQVVCGGKCNKEKRFFAPTILRDVPVDHAIMKEEIFGPVLPVLPVESVDAAIQFVNMRPVPLALYLFSSNTDTHQHVLNSTMSGGACINETVLHMAVPGLPFSGIGSSGMGSFHGKKSFNAFSHSKSVLRRATFVDPPVRYPPFSTMKLKLSEILS